MAVQNTISRANAPAPPYHAVVMGSSSAVTVSSARTKPTADMPAKRTGTPNSTKLSRVLAGVASLATPDTANTAASKMRVARTDTWSMCPPTV